MILAMVKMELIVQTSLKTQFYQKEQFALNYADFLLYCNNDAIIDLKRLGLKSICFDSRSLCQFDVTQKK